MFRLINAGNGCVRFSAVRTIHKWGLICGGMSCFAEVCTLKVLFQSEFTSINHASWKHCTYLPWYPDHIGHTRTAYKTHTSWSNTLLWWHRQPSEQLRCSGAQQDRTLSWSQLAYPGCCGWGTEIETENLIQLAVWGEDNTLTRAVRSMVLLVLQFQFQRLV